jgi:acyl-CoA synthetase (AMP-forming)/AMP-acid ligase II
MVFDPVRREAVGRAAEGSVRIVTSSGHDAGPDEVGEVWLRAAHPRSYFRDEAASAATFRGSWVRTGDLGRLDRDGYLYLVDREADVVKSGAYKISTVEVEAAIHEHPAVADVAVVGLPHAVLGSTLAAIVVTRAGAAAPTLAQLRSFLTTRLADHQLPARLVVVDELPRNEGGKVPKRQLIAQLKETHDDP